MRGTDSDGRSGVASPTRRSVLRVAGTLAVGATGLGAATGSVSAGEIKDCLETGYEAPASYPRIDLTDGSSTDDHVPHGVDELCIFAHGWNGTESSDDNAHALELALEHNGYEVPVAAARWEADTVNFWGAESNADVAGERLADWLREYRSQNPETTLRLLGHSLGARVSLATLSALAGDLTLETVSLFGAAVDEDDVCDDGTYADGIRESAERVYAYNSRDDDVICTIYGLQTWGDGLGCAGADCGGWFSDGSTADNYYDVDVTEAVGGHCEFILPEEGCVPAVVDDF